MSSEARPRVLISNAYSARNCGDGAIVLGMVAGLGDTAVFADAEFTVASADYPADSERYPFAVAPSFQSLANRVSRRTPVAGLFFLLVILPVSVLWAVVHRITGWAVPVPGQLGHLLRTYSQADLVIAAGGGYLYTRSPIQGFLTLFITLYSFSFARLLGRPVYLYAQSIGPFAGRFQELMVRLAARGVRLIQSREPATRRLLDSWELRTPVRDVADAAFLMPAAVSVPKLAVLEPDEHPRVGVTVRRWFSARADQETFEAAVATFVRHLVDDLGAVVIFVPQVTFSARGDDDRAAARRVAAAADRDDSIHLIETPLAPPEVKWLCGRMDLFVGTRMHSNIFAISQSVPTLAIAYQPKTVGMMDTLQLRDFVVSIESVNPETLAATFQRLWLEREQIRARLQASVPAIVDRARLGGKNIADDFANLRDPGRSRHEPSAVGS